MPDTKTKPEAKKDAPTEAQLATLAALTEDLGVEAPVISTAAEAQSAIEALQGLSAETEPEPEPQAEPDPEEEESEEQHAAEEAQARSGSERSDKQTQQMFERAVGRFRDSLRVVFEVDDLQPASAPGVIGFLLPGFTEQKTNEEYTRCLTCNGYGTVLTGAIKVGEETQPCPDGRCKGRGFWGPKSQQQQPQPPQFAITGPTAPEFAAPANGGGEWPEAPAWMGDPRLNTGGQP